MEKDDTTLVNETLSGNREAFAVIVNRYADPVYKFAYRYVRTGADAEDIAQEAFVRAWKNLKKFDASKSFKTWLFAIAKNAALDLIKKKKPMIFSRISEDEDVLHAFLEPYVAGTELPDAALVRKMSGEDLTAALAKLPPAYRTVLHMRYRDSLKFREIAEALEEPIDTVKSKHRRGLILLREFVAGDPPRSSFT